MNQPEHLFIRSEKEFRFYQNLVDHVFDQNKRLPQQVFRKNFDCFLFQEFEWALSDDILPAIKDLLNSTSDREFLTAVLKPDPVDYYFKEFGYYNWLKASVNISGEDYVNALWTHPKGSIADNIITNSNIVVWLSRSLQWAILADRDLEICIIRYGIKKRLSPKYFIRKRMETQDHSVLANWLELLFNQEKLTNEYFTRFQSNYSKLD